MGLAETLVEVRSLTGLTDHCSPSLSCRLIADARHGCATQTPLEYLSSLSQELLAC